VIATGFERSGMPRRIITRPITRTADGKPANRLQETVSVAAENKQPGEFQPQIFNTEDLDIPAFLRHPR
jgi:hypothetical protein